MDKDVYIIGVAGGSGSGKSTFAERIASLYGDLAISLKCDDYYYPHGEMTLKERSTLNFDSPDSLEFSLMKEHLSMLRSGKSVDCPIYDFTTHTRKKETRRVEPRPIVIVDGILVLHDPDIRSALDLKIYVETDADERILRRARRDMKERGREIDDIIAQYLTTVKPMHAKYVEPSKAHADIMLNGGLNDVSLDIVKAKLDVFLASRLDQK